MKVRTEYFKDEQNYGEYANFSVEIDGKHFCTGGNSEVEDACLGRDFHFVLSIPDILRKAWEAGKNGEPFELEQIEVDE